MSSITAQQAKLDLELVPKEKRLEIGKCYGRLNPGKIEREPTFQVVLDALALTLCYSTFLITADVPEVYMHQLWDSVYKHDTFYRFKLDKRKRFKLNLEVFKDIFKICPRVHGQDFDALPTDKEIVSFLRDLGHIREIHSLNDVGVDQMHQPCRTFAALINKSLSGKTSASTKEPSGKSKRVKRPAKKKPKAPVRVTTNAPSAAKIIPSVTSEGNGVKPGVPDVTEEESSKSEAESWGNDKDDSNNEQESSGEDSDQKNDKSDQKEDEDDEEVKDEFVKSSSNDFDDEDETKITNKVEGDEDEEMDYTTSELYDDVDIRLNEPVVTDKEFVQEEGTDAAMTNIQQGNENPKIV
ncbi:hypothetical protein Tco_0955643 [Tanacetum coccineum]|uniref:Uncharacterized protein n=1 Tax=Tanacetum coccineum TaxID=301880 RepID=A0ABQ5E7X6_9ASTR